MGQFAHILRRSGSDMTMATRITVNSILTKVKEKETLVRLMLSSWLFDGEAKMENQVCVLLQEILFAKGSQV